MGKHLRAIDFFFFLRKSGQCEGKERNLEEELGQEKCQWRRDGFGEKV